jgi:hypothetical protein
MAEGTSITVHEAMLYRLTIFSRNNLTNSQAFFGLREMNKAGDTIRYHWRPVPNGQASWQESSLLARPTPQTTGLQVYFRIAPESTGGSVWWDDVRLVEIPDTIGVTRPPPWRVAPLETLVLTREAAHTLPATLALRLEVGPEGHGGTLTTTLRPDFASGQVGGKIVWSSEHRLENAELAEVVVPTGELAEGRYRLQVSLVSTDRRTQLEFSKPLAVIAATTPPRLPAVQRSAVSTNGWLLVNGQPFSSVYYYHNSLDPVELKTLRNVYGATTAQVWGGESVDKLCERVDTAWQAGLYSWAVLFHPAMYDGKAKRWSDGPLTETVNRLKDHPGLIGWDLIDEPDGQGVPVEEVRRAFELVRRLDTNHVIWVNFCSKSKFADYDGLSDLASYDHYPLPTRGLQPVREHNRAIQSAFPDKPLLSVLQTYAAPGEGMPTPAQLRAQVYLNVCEGMTLFHYYSWFDPEPHGSLANSPELRSYTRLLNQELRNLEPFLFSTQRVAATVDAGARDQLVWLAKLVGKDVELVVANTKPTPVPRLRVSLAGRKITSAESRFDAPRKLTLSRGALMDALPGYGVGIYRLRVAGRAPPATTPAKETAVLPRHGSRRAPPVTGGCQLSLGGCHPAPPDGTRPS